MKKDYYIEQKLYGVCQNCENGVVEFIGDRGLIYVQQQASGKKKEVIKHFMELGYGSFYSKNIYEVMKNVEFDEVKYVWVLYEKPNNKLVGYLFE